MGQGHPLLQLIWRPVSNALWLTGPYFPFSNNGHWHNYILIKMWGNSLTLVTTALFSNLKISSHCLTNMSTFRIRRDEIWPLLEWLLVPQCALPLTVPSPGILSLTPRSQCRVSARHQPVITHATYCDEPLTAILPTLFLIHTWPADAKAQRNWNTRLSSRPPWLVELIQASALPRTALLLSVIC